MPGAVLGPSRAPVHVARACGARPLLPLNKGGNGETELHVGTARLGVPWFCSVGACCPSVAIKRAFPDFQTLQVWATNFTTYPHRERGLMWLKLKIRERWGEPTFLLYGIELRRLHFLSSS